MDGFICENCGLITSLDDLHWSEDDAMPLLCSVCYDEMYGDEAVDK